jgi:DNA polymerase-3 subunit epsilon
LDVTITHSALEAAVLESDEIKRHSPPYNIALRGRQRSMFFSRRSLCEYAQKADKDHCIGPLPAEKPAEALSALGTWLTGGFEALSDGIENIGTRIMGLPGEYTPEPDCLQQGLEMFHEKYRHRIKTQSPLRALTAIGAQLWRERLEAMAQAAVLDTEDDVDEAGDDDELPSEPFVWSPEAVEKATEGVFRRSAHLIRRARWFCMLSEASLGWGTDQTADGQIAAGQLNVLVISSGNIIRREKSIAAGMLPPPPGYAKPFAKRQKSFDVMTYDRLRVVTTELRRLIAEKRPLKMRLGPKAILYRQQLEKVLRWV